ncbi:MAG: TIGR04282 family arsenosugar biosynthesis glycosyltransferase [Stellaceae bacterium]
MTDGVGGFCAIAVMAKAPLVGEVKTRLAPPLSATEAAALSGCFIRDIADNIIAASHSAPIHGYLAYSPAGSEPVFRALLPEAIRLLPPRRSGLGHSLADAARDLLAAGYGSVCLVNSDSPTLPTAFLVDAAMALRAPDDRLVLGPAADGGYYCIGLKRPHLRLFEEIAWSTPRVFAQTCDRAREIGLAVVLLPPWYDVDDPASLRRLAGEVLGGERCGSGGMPYAASRTAAFLRCLFDDGGNHRLGVASPGRGAGCASG